MSAVNVRSSAVAPAVVASITAFTSMLPFVAVSAAAAPLLGLLGTVTGIINTFKLITVFGTGDVKTLSSGISEALITTELGLCVAIPSLLFHAYLSRKAKGVVDDMEKVGIAFVNQIIRTPMDGDHPEESQQSPDQPNDDEDRGVWKDSEVEAEKGELIAVSRLNAATVCMTYITR